MASGEDDLIARYFRPIATAPGALGLIDDAATLNVGGDDVIVTTDAIVEGVHFLPDDPPDTVARKALRVNLSDLAAKGGEPVGFVLTVALREATDEWLAPFARAMGEDAKQFNCPLLGGDTVATPGPLMISVTALGRVPPGRMVRRDGARAGHLLAVSGTVGDAALGLNILRNGSVAGMIAGDPAGRDVLIGRYRVPQPRNLLAAAVRDHASAAMDVSDGLAGDLAKLCKASGVSARVEVVSVPLSPVAIKALAQGAAELETVLAGGDDYEILCTIPENRWDSFVEAARAVRVPVTAIGRIVAGETAPGFVDGTGRSVVLKRLSYSHF
jgi:thiamine-monophosphate kinase